VEDALKITKNDLLSVLGGLPEQKVHCSMLAEDALKDAIRDYLSRNNLPVPQELANKYEKLRPLIEELRKKGYVLLWHILH
jgi:hypothetical protein